VQGDVTWTYAELAAVAILNASPANAGVHCSVARAADRWFPAFAGTAVPRKFYPVGDRKDERSSTRAHRAGDQ
jgi:hypothetical protein